MTIEGARRDGAIVGPGFSLGAAVEGAREGEIVGPVGPRVGDTVGFEGKFVLAGDERGNLVQWDGKQVVMVAAKGTSAAK